MNDIPPIVQQAYELLLQTELVEVEVDLHLSSPATSEDCAFECRISIPVPNSEDLPAKIRVRVAIPSTFPFARVSVYPCDESVRGFPHQDAETGKLCLPSQTEAPWNNTRLLCYIRWTIEWLADAANGRLVQAGHPYELPDFSRKLLGRPLPIPRPVFFVETHASFSQWQSRIGETGKVLFAYSHHSYCVLAVSWRTEQDEQIWEPPFTKFSMEKSRALNGHWLLLPDVRFFRHRPPQTYAELSDLCGRAGVDLDRILKLAWKIDNGPTKAGIVLVGFPIPKHFGDEPTEIHWQPLFIDNIFAESDNFKLRYNGKLQRRWSLLRSEGKFSHKQQLPWGTSTNIAVERQYARGAYSLRLRQMRTVICGCGALGSVIAELLARGGLESMALLDPQSFEIGNQTRHTLGGADIGSNKAISLAAKLSKINPLSEIVGFEASLPLPSPVPENLRTADESISAAALLLDTSADEGAFLWLDHLANRSGKRLASLFISFDARYLTFCISGKQTSCGKVSRKLFRSIQDGQTQISSVDYFRLPTKEEQVIPGAGCWHPTFPARIDHIWMLAGAAIDLLNRVIDRPIGCDGIGAVLRRNDMNFESSQPIVEMLWMSKYR